MLAFLDLRSRTSSRMCVSLAAVTVCWSTALVGVSSRSFLLGVKLQDPLSCDETSFRRRI